MSVTGSISPSLEVCRSSEDGASERHSYVDPPEGHKGPPQGQRADSPLDKHGVGNLHRNSPAASPPNKEDVGNLHRDSPTTLPSKEDLGNLHRSSPAARHRPKQVLDPRVDYSDFRIHILTWNIASAEPSPHDLESLFLPQKTCMIDDVFANSDLIVVGLQEAYQSVQDAMQSSVPLVGKDPLVEVFSTLLSQRGFARLCANRLLGILTLVFVKRPLLCYISGVESCTTKTGMSGWLGNKGASSVHFSLCDVTICFTNCHLAPQLENNPKRIQELAEILTTQSFPSAPSRLMDHDVLVLFGDLNFRLEGKSADEVIDTLTKGCGTDLLKCDQLHLEQIVGEESPSKLFNFMEMPISFPPSYKFRPGTDRYEPGAKERAPAWCDRILWRAHERRLPRITDPAPRSMLTQQHYAIHMQPRISDHKAVSAGMTVAVNLTNYVPRVVFNIMTEWVAGKTGLVAFEMEPNTEVSMWDWVGLYPADFSCMERDYVFWIYTPVKGRAVRGKVYRRTLVSEQVPSDPGRYVMLYKSVRYGCVLGMSPIFPIR